MSSINTPKALIQGHKEEEDFTPELTCATTGLLQLSDDDDDDKSALATTTPSTGGFLAQKEAPA